MSWITSQADQLLATDKVQVVLKDLDDLREWLKKHPMAGGSQDVFTFLEMLKKGQTAPSGTLSKAVTDRLLDWFDTTLKINGNDLETLRRLFSPLSQFKGQAEPQTIAWPLAWKSPDDSAPILLKASANLGAGIEANAALPDALGQAGANEVVVRVGVAGNLTASATGNLPVSNFKLTTGTETSASLSYQYYSAYPSDTTTIAAAGASLKTLECSALNLGQISALLQEKTFKGIAFQGQGQITFTGKAALATPLALNTVNIAELSLAFSSSLSGSFEYQICADTKFPNRVLLRLNRSRAKTDNLEIKASVGVNFNDFLKKAKAQILPSLQSATALLAKADDLLNPGDKIRAVLNEKIDALDGDTEKLLAPLLKSLLGLSSSANALTNLREAITQEITLRAADLEPKAKDAADAIFTSLADRLNLPEAAKTSLKEKLDGQIKDALATISSKSNDALAKLAKSPEAENIESVLKKSGIAVQDKLSAADNKLANVRSLVQHYRDKLKQIYDAFSNTTELKLTATLGLTHTETESQSFDLVLSFDPAVAAANEAFHLAMLGSFEQTQHLVFGNNLGVEILDCLWKDVIKHDTTVGIGISVLGFSLTSETLLSSNIQILTDYNNNITAVDTGSITRRKTLGGESNAFYFADIFQLVTAKKTKSLRIEVVLSHVDKKLQPAEATSFLGSLVSAGLLNSDSPNQANALLADHAGQEGSVAVHLDLDQAAVEQLIGVNTETEKFKASVLSLAAEQLAQAYSADLTPANRKWLLNKLSDIGIKENTVALAILKAATGHADVSAGSDWNLYLDFIKMRDICTSLAEALSRMCELYEVADDASPERQAKLADPHWYAEQQDSIAFKMSNASDPHFPKLLGTNESVKAQTLAIFRILAILAGKKVDSDSNIVTATLTLGTGANAKVRTLS